MSYIKVAEFEALLATNAKANIVIQEYIDRFEKKYIHQILGVKLGDLFLADAEPPPSTGVFKVLEDPISEQEDRRIYESLGMRKLLVFFILYHYVKDKQSAQGLSGTIFSNVETAIVLGFENATRYGEVRFNEALVWARTIQWFACEFKPEDYPKYDGVHNRPKYSPLI